MGRREIDRFVADVRNNRGLLQELAEGVIGLGHFVDRVKQAGYKFTVEEAKAYIREQHHPQITDDELEQVVGAGVSNVVTDTNAVTQAEAVTLAVEAQTVATTSTATAEAETVAAVVAVGVIVAS